MIHNENRTLGVVVGAERSGKTYSVEKMANHYAKYRGPVIAYNAGRITDFIDYEFIEIVYPIDMAWRLYPGKRQSFERTKHTKREGVTHFKFRQNVYHLKHFNRMFTRREGALKLKMYRVADAPIEMQFFKSCSLYLSGCLLIMDDARPITKPGVRGPLAMLLNKKNHGGQLSEWFRKSPKLLGIDVIMIYHSLPRVSPEIFDYADHITLFQTTQKPGKSIENDDVAEELEKCYKYLKGVGDIVPKYTSTRTYIKGPNANTSVIIPPSIVNRL
jgi:hypothetical protein